MRSAVASVLCSSPAGISISPASGSIRAACSSATFASVTAILRDCGASGHGAVAIASGPTQTG